MNNIKSKGKNKLIIKNLKFLEIYITKLSKIYYLKNNYLFKN